MLIICEMKEQNPIPDCLTEVGKTSIACSHMLEWKFNANDKQHHPQKAGTIICLNVGDDKGGRDVHLEDHAEHLDHRRDASISVL